MNLIEAATSRFQAMLERLFAGLKDRVADLGMNLSVHDDDGRCTGALEPRCEFCRQVCASGRLCADAHSALAETVLQDNAPHQALGQRDFILRFQVIELFDFFDQERSFQVERLVIQNGLPVRMTVAGMARTG